jgi:hypothetical protein
MEHCPNGAISSLVTWSVPWSVHKKVDKNGGLLKKNPIIDRVGRQRKHINVSTAVELVLVSFVINKLYEWTALLHSFF